MIDPRGVRRGQDVYGADGCRIGRVFQCDETGFVVEKGIVFTQDRRVPYDEVVEARAGEVHLRSPASALLPEEEAEAWSPPRDPTGTAWGVDLEPLRAGMAELDPHRRRVPRAAPPSSRPAQAHPAPSRTGLERAAGRGRRAARMRLDAEVSRRVAEEIEDYEREGGCAPQGPPPALEPREPAVALQAEAAGAPARADGALPGAAEVPLPASRPGPAGPPRRVDYREAAPEAIAALRALEGYVRRCHLERPLLELVRVRASQLNGCAYCIDVHARDARREGETEQRLYALAAWWETPFFTDRERAALAWTEAVTRVGASHVDDDVYQLARAHFAPRELVDLTMAVIAVNGWNRLAVAFRTEPGSYQPVAGE